MQKKEWRGDDYYIDQSVDYNIVGTMIFPQQFDCQLTSYVWLLRMLEALNYAIGTAQPFGLYWWVKKHPLWSLQYELPTMWQPCWVVTISTSLFVTSRAWSTERISLINNGQSWAWAACRPVMLLKGLYLQLQARHGFHCRTHLGVGLAGNECRMKGVKMTH